MASGVQPHGLHGLGPGFVNCTGVDKFTDSDCYNASTQGRDVAIITGVVIAALLLLCYAAAFLTSRVCRRRAKASRQVKTPNTQYPGAVGSEEEAATGGTPGGVFTPSAFAVLESPSAHRVHFGNDNTGTGFATPVHTNAVGYSPALAGVPSLPAKNLTRHRATELTSSRDLLTLLQWFNTKKVRFTCRAVMLYHPELVRRTDASLRNMSALTAGGRGAGDFAAAAGAARTVACALTEKHLHLFDGEYPYGLLESIALSTLGGIVLAQENALLVTTSYKGIVLGPRAHPSMVAATTNGVQTMVGAPRPSTTTAAMRNDVLDMVQQLRQAVSRRLVGRAAAVKGLAPAAVGVKAPSAPTLIPSMTHIHASSDAVPAAQLIASSAVHATSHSTQAATNLFMQLLPAGASLLPFVAALERQSSLVFDAAQPDDIAALLVSVRTDRDAGGATSVEADSKSHENAIQELAAFLMSNASALTLNSQQAVAMASIVHQLASDALSTRHIDAHVPSVVGIIHKPCIPKSRLRGFMESLHAAAETSGVILSLRRRLAIAQAVRAALSSCYPHFRANEDDMFTPFELAHVLALLSGTLSTKTTFIAACMAMQRERAWHADMLVTHDTLCKMLRRCALQQDMNLNEAEVEELASQLLVHTVQEHAAASALPAPAASHGVPQCPVFAAPAVDLANAVCALAIVPAVQAAASNLPRLPVPSGETAAPRGRQATPSSQSLERTPAAVAAGPPTSTSAQATQPMAAGRVAEVDGSARASDPATPALNDAAAAALGGDGSRHMPVSGSVGSVSVTPAAHHAPAGSIAHNSVASLRHRAQPTADLVADMFEEVTARGSATMMAAPPVRTNHRARYSGMLSPAASLAGARAGSDLSSTVHARNVSEASSLGAASIAHGRSRSGVLQRVAAALSMMSPRALASSRNQGGGAASQVGVSLPAGAAAAMGAGDAAAIGMGSGTPRCAMSHVWTYAAPAGTTAFAKSMSNVCFLGDLGFMAGLQPVWHRTRASHGGVAHNAIGSSISRRRALPAPERLVAVEPSSTGSRGSKSGEDEWERRRSVLEIAQEYRVLLVWIGVQLLCCAAIIGSELRVDTLKRHQLAAVFGSGFMVARISAQLSLFFLTVLGITRLKKAWTFLGDHAPGSLVAWLPIEQNQQLHIYAGHAFMLMALVHTGAHLYNFSIAAGTVPEVLNVMLGTQFLYGEPSPSLACWLFTTLPGLTGIFLLVCLLILTPFAMERVRRASFAMFHAAHRLYMLLYPLLILHGSLALLAKPNAWKYIGPTFLLFLVEQYVTLSRAASNTVPIIAAKLLPGRSVQLTIARPLGWTFLSGQYVQVTCPAVAPGSAHPFTISSAPQEPHLQLTIKAVGPWTNGLRSLLAALPSVAPVHRNTGGVTVPPRRADSASSSSSSRRSRQVAAITNAEETGGVIPGAGVGVQLVQQDGATDLSVLSQKFAAARAFSSASSSPDMDEQDITSDALLHISDPGNAQLLAQDEPSGRAEGRHDADIGAVVAQLHLALMKGRTSELRGFASNGFPYLVLEGPHGSPSQQWWRYPSVCLVAGGIGVTPMLSVLSDVLYRLHYRSAGLYSELQTRSIEFIWVARTLAEASWLRARVRSIERTDGEKSRVRMHLYITAQESWDAGATRITTDTGARSHDAHSGTPLFSVAISPGTAMDINACQWSGRLLGFESTKVHFRRPKFDQILQQLKREHAEDPCIGVFACGPKPLLASLADAVRRVNTRELGPTLHAFEEHF